MWRKNCHVNMCKIAGLQASNWFFKIVVVRVMPTNAQNPHGANPCSAEAMEREASRAPIIPYSPYSALRKKKSSRKNGGECIAAKWTDAVAVVRCSSKRRRLRSES